MFDRIIVGVDGRPGGLRAVRVASALAALCHADLTLVHVHPRAVAVTDHERERATLELRETARAVVAEARRECHVEAASVVVESASPARGLHEQAEARGADLLVLGSSQRSAMERVLAGDTARAVLHGAPCAVALVAPDAAVPARGLRVAAGWNGSPESEAALRCACALAGAAAGELTVVRAVSPPIAFAPRYAYAYNWTEMAEIARDRAQSRLDERLRGAEVPAQGRAVVGSTSTVLEAVSRDADVLVLGSRGFGPVRRLLVGSTVEGLVVHSHCILLVLPRPDHAGAPAAADATPRAAAPADRPHAGSSADR